MKNRKTKIKDKIKDVRYWLRMLSTAIDTNDRDAMRKAATWTKTDSDFLLDDVLEYQGKEKGHS